MANIPSTGSWNLPFGIGNIPDIGLSEGIGLGGNYQYLSGIAPSGQVQGQNTSTPNYGGNQSWGAGPAVPTSTTQNYSQPTQNTTPAVQNLSMPSVDTGDYVKSINDMFDSSMSGLNSQYAPQQDIVTNNYNQGVSDLNSSAQTSYGQLDTSTRKANENQVKNLRDIGTNLQNQYMAGNAYLGAKGAGDSSAANMYSYALGKVGSQQRGDVMNNTSSILADIQDRKTQITNSVTQGLKQLLTEKNNALASLASQFASAQQAIRDTKGANIANLNQQLLSDAMSRMNSIQNSFADNANNLRTWALNNASTVQQLQGNLAAVGGINYNMPQAQQFGTGFSATGNTAQPTYWSATNDKLYQ